MKSAVFHEFGLSPASWKAKTTRTDAAMTRNAPNMSSSLIDRRSAWRIWCAFGHAIMKIIIGAIPMGALNGQ